MARASGTVTYNTTWSNCLLKDHCMPILLYKCLDLHKCFISCVRSVVFSALPWQINFILRRFGIEGIKKGQIEAKWRKKKVSKRAASHAYLNFTLRLFYLNFYLLIYKRNVKEFFGLEAFSLRRDKGIRKSVRWKMWQEKCRFRFTGFGYSSLADWAVYY